MGQIAAWRKKLVLRSYVQKLPGLLRRDYGVSSAYTPSQVRQTISRSGLNENYSCYAISLFSSRASFEEYHRTLGESCDYEGMRGEIAAFHPSGTLDFITADVSGTAGGGHGSYYEGDGGHGHEH